jgi:putative ABC transport system substrate-binding protein
VTDKVPAVFVAVGDPVGGGFVASLARPGGNVTGFTSFEPSMGGKWLAVLKDVNRALVILHPETAVHQAFWHSAQEAALRLGIRSVPALSITPPKSRGPSLPLRREPMAG